MFGSVCAGSAVFVSLHISTWVVVAQSVDDLAEKQNVLGSSPGSRQSLLDFGPGTLEQDTKLGLHEELATPPYFLSACSWDKFQQQLCNPAWDIMVKKTEVESFYWWSLILSERALPFLAFCLCSYSETKKRRKS